MKILVGLEAESHIVAIDAWWREHRSAAPNLFCEELAAALQALAAMPWVGSAHPHATEKGVRRIGLRATRYHVYYRARGDIVEILAVWSAVRGSGPDLAHLG